MEDMIAFAAMLDQPGSRLDGSTRNRAPSSASELDCLTQAVYFEARGETPRGQAAVAQVVMNRVNHPAFPKTVCGVVYQGAARSTGCQFSFACDGSMRRGREAAAGARALDADDPARVRRIGEAALAAGQKGELLTRRLTAFSQGDDEPVLRVIDAGVLLRGLEGRLRELAGPGVDLMIEGPAEPAEARVDPVAFEGAVKALTRNGVVALAGQGSVAVRLEALLEGGMRLSVRDNGPGMDRDLAARAVEPFFTTREGAAGLGLSQAYAFARQSGGVLSIDSSPGQGAEVSITLPAAS